MVQDALGLASKVCDILVAVKRVGVVLECHTFTLSLAFSMTIVFRVSCEPQQKLVSKQISKVREIRIILIDVFGLYSGVLFLSSSSFLSIFLLWPGLCFSASMLTRVPVCVCFKKRLPSERERESNSFLTQVSSQWLPRRAYNYC